jgi:hypothetical protein
VRLFGRRKALHERLAEAAGMAIHAEEEPFAVLPPGWDRGSPLAEPAFHGIARPRRWEVVVTAEAAGLDGTEVHFLALPHGQRLVDGNEPSTALAPLADAVEASLDPPYRAEAVRRAGDSWTIGASAIEVVEVPGLDGDDAELTSLGGTRTLLVDGRPTLQQARELELAGEERGRDYAVRARRLEGDLWQVEAAPL